MAQLELPLSFPEIPTVEVDSARFDIVFDIFSSIDDTLIAIHMRKSPLYKLLTSLTKTTSLFESSVAFTPTTTTYYNTNAQKATGTITCR